MSKHTPRRPSASDRAHFDVIAEAMAREKREQIEHAADDASADGILVGLELARLAAWSPEQQAMDDARADAQIELHRRWRRLRGRAR